MFEFEHLRRRPGELRTDVSATCGCEDPVGCLKTMFVDLVQRERIAGGQDPALRPVFLKVHGIAHGTLSVVPDLPRKLRVGVFAHESFPSWVRFSSDTLPSLPDLRTTVGIGIKLFGVPGTKVLEPETGATTHDFVMQNHDVFFVDTALDMCEFTHAGVIDGDYGPYLEAHPVTQQILDDMQKVVESMLRTEYWSVLPYAFGSERYVKYKLAPTTGPGAADPEETSTQQAAGDDPGYLRADLRARLLRGPASFDLSIQLRTDEDAMPLDRATVRWPETASPPVHVATLTLPQQDVDAHGQAAYGENLSFSPWHALKEHEPVGSIAEARKVVYLASATLRRDVNGIPVGEPVHTRPGGSEVGGPGEPDRTIVRAAIHPAIGVARVGNSEDGFFMGPEVPCVPDPDAPPDGYKDATGALKRQAALFRVYGYNAAGEVVSELTLDNAAIEWTAHVANTKAAWYQFQIALDIPEAPSADPSALRNSSVTGAARSGLAIDPGPRSVRGRDRSGAEFHFDTGRFMGRDVYLGELRTDGSGRLVFLGGRGVSASADGSPATTFANNDGWYDDVSDGPVTATVTVDGRPVPTDPAWVVVGPPNYAPDVLSVRTVYDLLFDAFVEQGSLPFPERVSFTRDVYPILRRMCDLEWVNHGFAAQFGWTGRNRFLDPAYLRRLSSTAGEDTELRRQVYNTFRNFQRDGKSPVPWPWVYGDAMNLPPVSARQHVMLSSTQMRLLERWAAGSFDPDLDPDAPGPRSLSDVPLADQPQMLDRAALDLCLADAFHPGCEMTWPMRHTTMYMAPFRIRHRPSGAPTSDYGPVLTPEITLGVEGPLYAQGPGDISRWMAVPWQTDTASCRAGYEGRYDPYLPTFWPARVPNHVLSDEDYLIVTDPDAPAADRRAAFERRAVWLRFLTGTYEEQINQMVAEFGKLGVVEPRPGVADDPDFPPRMLVESEVGFPTEEVPALRNLLIVHVPEAQDPATAEPAINQTLARFARPEGEVVAGFIDKVSRFRRRDR